MGGHGVVQTCKILTALWRYSSILSCFKTKKHHVLCPGDLALPGTPSIHTIAEQLKTEQGPKAV
eukprot:scaffold122640_cov17-Tisochrysis_lutea.AAC.2